MRFSEALKQMGAFYIPGTVAHFARKVPDRWQAVHDSLERALSTKDQSVLEAMCDRFVSDARALVDEFSRECAPSESVTPADAFAIGDERRVRSYLSIKTKSCAFCDSRKALRIRSVAADSIDVELVCAACEGTGL